MQAITQNTVEQPSPWERLGYACGIAAAALYLTGAAIFIGFIVPLMPPLDAPPEQSAPFYAEMHGNLLYRSVSYLGQAQMAMLVLFFGALFGLLRRAERGSGSLSAAVFAAGIMLAVITPLAIMFEDHLLLGFAVAGVEPTIVRGFDGLVPLSFALGGFPQAIVLGGTAALLVRQRLAPRWLGWSAGVLAVLSVIGTLTLVDASMFPLAALAMLLFRIWTLALSIALLQRTRTAHQPIAGHVTT